MTEVTKSAAGEQPKPVVRSPRKIWNTEISVDQALNDLAKKDPKDVQLAGLSEVYRLLCLQGYSFQNVFEDKVDGDKKVTALKPAFIELLKKVHSGKDAKNKKMNIPEYEALFYKEGKKENGLLDMIKTIPERSSAVTSYLYGGNGFDGIEDLRHARRTIEYEVGLAEGLGELKDVGDVDGNGDKGDLMDKYLTIQKKYYAWDKTFESSTSEIASKETAKSPEAKEHAASILKEAKGTVVDTDTVDKGNYVLYSSVIDGDASMMTVDELQDYYLRLLIMGQGKPKVIEQKSSDTIAKDAGKPKGPIVIKGQGLETTTVSKKPGELGFKLPEGYTLVGAFKIKPEKNIYILLDKNGNYKVYSEDGNELPQIKAIKNADGSVTIVRENLSVLMDNDSLVPLTKDAGDPATKNIKFIPMKKGKGQPKDDQYFIKNGRIYVQVPGKSKKAAHRRYGYVPQSNEKLMGIFTDMPKGTKYKDAKVFAVVKSPVAEPKGKYQFKVYKMNTWTGKDTPEFEICYDYIVDAKGKISRLNAVPKKFSEQIHELNKLHMKIPADHIKSLQDHTR